MTMTDLLCFFVKFHGKVLAGFVHLKDAEHYQQWRCEGLGCSPSMYPIYDQNNRLIESTL